jgi:CarD family transcriptional regulator
MLLGVDMGPEKVFRVGQKAVYPCDGVGTIENIENRSIGGQNEDFYVLKIHATGAKVMVPTRAAASVGLRSVISAPEVESIYDILKSPSKKFASTFNRRYRALTDKLNSGKLTDIAEVLRDLSCLKNTKDLSFSEKKMLERARTMIVSEICAAKDMERNMVEGEINKILLLTPISIA